jgi:DNA-directed RNA polymerase subunit RPC12/RpoP
VRTPVEKWLLRQIAGELMGNFVIGSIMSVLAVPLVMLHVFMLWVVIEVLRGRNPWSELFGKEKFEPDSSLVIAAVVFIIWFVGYLWWKKLDGEESRWEGKKEENPNAMDITLVIGQILFAAPMVMRSAYGFYHSMAAWVKMDTASCAAVLVKLLESPHRIALEVLQRELPELDIEGVARQLRMIPGVVFLKSAPAGLSLTGELRQTLAQQRWADDWKPPPKEERLEFVCIRCGQRLRLRRFQSGHTIRCPKCQAWYLGRMDRQGRLRIEPEPERERTAPPRQAPLSLAMYYTILGLPQDADLPALRRAYRRAMKQYHPDLYAMADAAKRAQVEERAKQINEAYHGLLDHLEGKG